MARTAAAPVVTGGYCTAADGTRLWVERCGSGPPLLLIPGLGAGTWLWSALLPHLAVQHSLIMPELRGGGRSDKPDARYSVEQFASDMRSVLDACDVRTCDLLGVSLGGYVAQCFAARWPDRVRRLVLAATSLGGDAQTGPAGEVLVRLIRPHGRSRRERLEDAYALGFTPEYRAAHSATLDAITAWRMEHRQPEAAYYRQLLAGHAWQGEYSAQHIRAAALVCAGADDAVVPLCDVRALAAGIPGARLAVFPGCHLFFMEHADAFASAAASFLAA